ncbi:MAG: hypothetical protein ABIB43_04585 [archaeon]
MYGWGSDTSTWKKPGKYKYDSAKSPYLDSLASKSAAKGPRTYNIGSEPNMKLVNPRGRDISSDSENPIIIGVDVTGSMSTWPAEIFDRLPLFYQTLSQYKDDLDISFGAIGDAYCDTYPIQVNSFGKEVNLEEHLKALYPEGGGGGQNKETYELFAYYILEHCKTPKAKSPFMFIFGDEDFYKTVNPKQVEHYIGDKLESPMKSKDVWDKLLQRFDLYLLHKPYGSGSDDKEVVDSWANAIGRQRIVELPSKERAVDIAMGIVAKKWGKFSDFKDNLSARHDSDGVKDSVYKSIAFVDVDSSPNSVVKTTKKGTKTKPLSEMP